MTITAESLRSRQSSRLRKSGNCATSVCTCSSFDYINRPCKLYANYIYVDATNQSFGQLNFPSNPNAIADSNTGIQFINAVPGDHIGGIPANRFKGHAEYAVTDKWKVGADLNVVGNEYLFGDGTNQSPQVPAYAAKSAHVLSTD
jgi:iron complex outermembrane recepter protein